MTQRFKLTSADFVPQAEDTLIPEAVLDENDPIQDLRSLAGIPTDLNSGRLQQYTGDNSVVTGGSNPSITANEKIQYQNNNNIQPGSPDWFRLWFSKPYITGEKPW